MLTSVSQLKYCSTLCQLYMSCDLFDDVQLMVDTAILSKSIIIIIIGRKRDSESFGALIRQEIKPCSETVVWPRETKDLVKIQGFKSILFTCVI